jgi:hypothetical protein
MPIDVLDDEAPDLALPAGQLGCRLHLTLRGVGDGAEHMFDSTVRTPPDGVKPT